MRFVRGHGMKILILALVLALSVVSAFAQATPIPFGTIITESTGVVTSDFPIGLEAFVAFVVMGAGMWLLRKLLRVAR